MSRLRQLIVHCGIDSRGAIACHGCSPCHAINDEPRLAPKGPQFLVSSSAGAE
jgi:hypothetical protein